jgi:hypothetical protein
MRAAPRAIPAAAPDPHRDDGRADDAGSDDAKADDAGADDAGSDDARADDAGSDDARAGDGPSGDGRSEGGRAEAARPGGARSESAGCVSPPPALVGTSGSCFLRRRSHRGCSPVLSGISRNDLACNQDARYPPEQERYDMKRRRAIPRRGVPTSRGTRGDVSEQYAAGGREQAPEYRSEYICRWHRADAWGTRPVPATAAGLFHQRLAERKALAAGARRGGTEEEVHPERGEEQHDVAGGLDLT